METRAFLFGLSMVAGKFHRMFCCERNHHERFKQSKQKRTQESEKRGIGSMWLICVAGELGSIRRCFGSRSSGIFLVTTLLMWKRDSKNLSGLSERLR
jgi:hypothetical protein